MNDGEPEVKGLRQALRAMVRNERGQVLPTVFLLLILGALLIVPALDYGSTSLKGTQVTEKKELELYAADSGVTDAVFWLQEDGDTGGRWNWDDVDLVWKRDTYELNDRTVDVDIEDLGGNTYKVTSEAKSAEGGSTTIESVVVLRYYDFGFLIDNAITSNNEVHIGPGGIVNGDIQLPDPDDLDNKGTHNGDVNNEPLEWPPAEAFMEWFWDRLMDQGGTLYDSDQYDVHGNPTESDPEIIGPMYTEGPLTIKGRGWIQLGEPLGEGAEGMLYIKGNLDFLPTPTIYLNLNGQTIFAEGAISMGPDVNIIGSGCIVAVGDIDFQPTIPAGSEDNCIVTMSIEGQTWLKPTGDYYGCVIGNSNVDLQPGYSLNYVDPEGYGLIFPQGEGSAGDEGTTVTVATYNIS